MARTQYVVGPHGSGGWMITYGVRVAGPYSTQREAIRSTVDAANQAAGGAQVLVQETDGTLRAEWTYGKDPYPPPGLGFDCYL